MVSEELHEVIDYLRDNAMRITWDIERSCPYALNIMESYDRWCATPGDKNLFTLLTIDIDDYRKKCGELQFVA